LFSHAEAMNYQIILTHQLRRGMAMKKLFIWLAVVLLLVITGCKSSQKAITSFNFENPAAVGVITESTHSIAVTVPYGTDVTGLIPTITYTGETISPASGAAQDFTNPVVYIVTSGTGSTQDYTITVTVASISAKSITAFSLAGVAGTINETGKTISVTMPSGTNVTSLVATFTTTGASVKVGSTIQISGTTARNFTNPVVYTVTAADATTQDYTVTVTLGS
jgi:hypothetical protein